jgi:transcriptional regulator with XRE-family HTH domain
MPRPKPKNDLNKHIGLRVGYVRRIDFVSQADVAKLLGLSRDQLANIESGLVPMRAGVGWRFCREFMIHPDWLIYGYGRISLPDLGDAKMQEADRFFCENRKRPFAELWPEWWGESYDHVKLIVDNPFEGVILSPVGSEIPTWKQIVAELRRLTNSRGAKTVLAADLKTTRQNVNKWLSGKGTPGTELTLDVLRWVKRHRR